MVDILKQPERTVALLTVLRDDHHIDIGLRQAQLRGKRSEYLHVRSQFFLDPLRDIVDKLIQEGALPLVLGLDNTGFILDVLLQVELEFVGGHHSVLELFFLFFTLLQLLSLKFSLFLLCELLY